MPSDRDLLQGWIEEERPQLIEFLQGFVRAKSPNPPGDTRAAAQVITDYLSRAGLPYRVIAPQETMPNIVGSFEGGSPGRHLVLNGHIDCFPVGEGHGWTQDPWGGAIVDGKLYGRGAADMKTGTTASIMTYRLLHRIKDRLKGRLTLTAVSDEETFGPWGARYLLEHHPEVHGDCLLNGEPGSPYSIRFGEKGPLWLEFTVRTPGAHGAYTHYSKSATKLAMQLARDLEAVTEIKPEISDNIRAALEQGHATMEKAMGAGAAAAVSAVTLNVGTIRGGLKVNMVASEVRLRDRHPAPGRRRPEPGAGRRRQGAQAVSGSDHARDAVQRALLVRSQRRDGGDPAAERDGAQRFHADPDRQPRRHRRSALALSEHSRLRLRALPARHGLDG